MADEQVAVTLANTATAVRDARRLAAATLDAWGYREDAVDDVILVVSELVTNAVLHATGAVGLLLLASPGGVRIEVTDSVPVLPAVESPTPTAEHGRGLAIVATLAARWGSRLTAAGKVVWADLVTDDKPADPDLD
jgi:anti-sigma regulatory factor (Ser/Thr protein kinase)